MAVKKTAPKMKRTKKQHTPDYYPVQRTIPLSGTTAANGKLVTGVMTADAGRLLSQSNRRMYRYGMKYRMKLDIDVPAAVDVPFDIEVFALRNNWDTQRAFALAKKHYDEAIADELNSTENARWLDFRVFHGTAGVDLHPVVVDNSTLSTNVPADGEHALSLVDKGGVGHNFTWGAASSTRIDIKNEWIQSGRVSDDPSTPITSAPYDGLNADRMSDIEQTGIQERGNKPPYNETSQNDLLVQIGTLRYEPGTVGLQKLSTGFFDAPCGLFVIKVTSGINLPAGAVHFTAQSGDYKGVHAEGMCN